MKNEIRSATIVRLRMEANIKMLWTCSRRRIASVPLLVLSPPSHHVNLSSMLCQYHHNLSTGNDMHVNLYHTSISLLFHRNLSTVSTQSLQYSIYCQSLHSIMSMLPLGKRHMVKINWLPPLASYRLLEKKLQIYRNGWTIAVNLSKIHY